MSKEELHDMASGPIKRSTKSSPPATDADLARGYKRISTKGDDNMAGSKGVKISNTMVRGGKTVPARIHREDEFGDKNMAKSINNPKTTKADFENGYKDMGPAC